MTIHRNQNFSFTETQFWIAKSNPLIAQLRSRQEGTVGCVVPLKKTFHIVFLFIQKDLINPFSHANSTVV